MDETYYYRQCEMTSPSDDEGGYYRDVAWLPLEEVRVGRLVRFGDDPRVWKIVSAGDPRPAQIVEAYAEHGRRRWGSLVDA